jgi:hypothetical protein
MLDRPVGQRISAQPQATPIHLGATQMAHTFQSIGLEVAAGVATLTLNRGE